MRSTSCCTPRSRLRSASACSKRWPSMPSTTSPYIWIRRRYESRAKRALPVAPASPASASSFRPRFRIVSIIPGIETAAPERTETSSGSPVSPKRLPVRASSLRDVLGDLVLEPRRQAALAQVRAAGVGRDREAGRHGNAELRHLGEPDALAAEQLAAAVGGLVEVVDVAGHGPADLSHRFPDGFPADRRASAAIRAPPSSRPSSSWQAAAGCSSTTPRARGSRARELDAEVTQPLVLSVAAGRPARARPRAGRDHGRRRQHGEHARRLARARLRPVFALAGGRRVLYDHTASPGLEGDHLDAEVTHLAFYPWPPAELRSLALAHDVILVAGGSTANMLAVWRVHGFDRVLREAWETGVVLTGWSAGMICWFEAGVTDSFGPQLAGLDDGLGFLPGSACPHYDGEAARRPVYERLVREGFPAGHRARRRRRRALPRDGARGDRRLVAERSGLPRHVPTARPASTGVWSSWKRCPTISTPTRSRASSAEGWGFDVETADYAPLGAGSYHWLVRDRSGRARFRHGRRSRSEGVVRRHTRCRLRGARARVRHRARPPRARARVRRRTTPGP